MLGLKKSVALLAIIVLLLTTLFSMIGAVLADETGPGDQTGGKEMQPQENQAEPASGIQGTAPEPVIAEPANAQEETPSTPAETVQGNNEEKAEVTTPAPEPEVTNGDSDSAGSQQDNQSDNESEDNGEGEVNNLAEPTAPDNPGVDPENCRHEQPQDPENHEEAECSIFGRVFCDEDGNEHCGKDETGLADIPILLSGEGDSSIKTDSEGRYRFEGLKPGNYVVAAGVSGKWTCTSANPESVCLGTWPRKSARVDFACHCPEDEEEEGPGCIHGTKFEDKNGNGHRDHHEPGIEGITIWAGDHPAVTDGDGDYWFEYLAPGEYTVREECPEGWECTTGGEKQITLKSYCEERVDFGNCHEDEEEPCCIHGTKFEDKNGNGCRDHHEPGIEGIKIWAGDECTYTDGDGDYWFEDLPPGEYIVREECPEGWECTTGGEHCVTLEHGCEKKVDFGNKEKELGAIHVYKFEDLNGNGVLDTGEPGIPDVKIELWWLCGYQEAYTDSGGHAIFEDLDPILYTVRVDESTAPEGMIPTTSIWALVWIKCGEEVSVYFGEARTGSISGYKFNDLNGNGVMDPGEPGIPGVRIVLWFWSQETTTDANGYYIFEGLTPALYKVWVDESTAPAGFIPSTATWALVWLSSGQDVTDVNFGNMTPEQPTGTIPGNKFEDSNWDGEHDEGEPGLPGFDFTVADQSDPNTILDTMTSDADGSFAFDNLPPGTYIVKEVTPSAESNYHQTGQTEWIVPLTAGETAGPVTFLNAPHCNVIGTKYIDSDASGNISGNDATYPGLPIALTGININGESVSLSTSTDANGDYAFTDLMAGNYTVTEDLSATTLTPILGPSLPANPAPLENLEVNFLNSNDVEVSPEGPITPETPTSVEPVGLGDSTPAVSESVSAETLPGTGMNELPLLLIAGFLMLAGILFLAFGVFRRRKLA